MRGTSCRRLWRKNIAGRGNRVHLQMEISLFNLRDSKKAKLLGCRQLGKGMGKR